MKVIDLENYDFKILGMRAYEKITIVDLYNEELGFFRVPLFASNLETAKLILQVKNGVLKLVLVEK